MKKEERKKGGGRGREKTYELLSPSSLLSPLSLQKYNIIGICDFNILELKLLCQTIGRKPRPGNGYGGLLFVQYFDHLAGGKFTQYDPDAYCQQATSLLQRPHSARVNLQSANYQATTGQPAVSGR